MVVQYVLLLLENTWEIWREAAPWLLVGLVLAGILKAWFPPGLLQRWLGGRGPFAVLKAAVIGTPLPLCSCSVLPTAIQLHRSGASKGTTVSFLVATPENGADSIALSYVLLGPVMMIIRPVAAILSAVTTGLLAESLSGRESEPADSASPDSGTTRCTTSYCGAKATGAAVQAGRLRSLVAGLRHAVFDLLDDIAGWLLIGILLAAALETFVPANAMTQWGSGLLPMLAILLISIPMYICATASTPVAASMLLAGISPGTVLVFLLAGPATNLASAGLLRRELGLRATVAYLVGIAATSVGLGLAVDLLLAGMEFSPASQIDMTGELVPPSISLVTAILLGLLAVKPMRRITGRIWRAPFARQSTRGAES
jgi:uncharacterized membrane protein YraQ (UPF0718 family)